MRQEAWEAPITSGKSQLHLQLVRHFKAFTSTKERKIFGADAEVLVREYTNGSLIQISTILNVLGLSNEADA